MIENLLSHHDKPLLRHFVKYEVTTQVGMKKIQAMHQRL